MHPERKPLPCPAFSSWPVDAGLSVAEEALLVCVLVVCSSCLEWVHACGVALLICPWHTNSFGSCTALFVFSWPAAALDLRGLDGVDNLGDPKSLAFCLVGVDTLGEPSILACLPVGVESLGDSSVLAFRVVGVDTFGETSI